MSAPAIAVTRRPAGPRDDAFLADVFASTRDREFAALPLDAEQRAAFLAQQVAAQRAHYARHFPDAAFEVVLAGGVAAGRLLVDRREDALHVVDIALLPEHRSRGIGTRLLDELSAEAGARGVPVTAHVERSNRALRLYLRLGFVPVSDHGLHLLLERPPAGGGDSAEDGLVTDAGGVAADGHEEELERAEIGVLDGVDPLGQERLGRPAEEHGEGRAAALVVDGRRTGSLRGRLDELEPHPVAGDERVADRRCEGVDGEPVEHGAERTPPTLRPLTRRLLLGYGAAAAAGWLAGLRPWAPASARAAGAPLHLRRSAWAGLVGDRVAAGTVSLRLESIADVAGPGLAGRDDAFVLTFAGAGGDVPGSGTHELGHPALGTFALFVSPVGRPGASATYEAIVDRSVGAGEDAVADPARAAPADAGPPGAAAPATATAPPSATGQRRAAARVAPRRAALRRTARGLRCEVDAGPGARRVMVRVLSGGRTVALLHGTVRDGRARLPLRRHLRPGTFRLVVTTAGADGLPHTIRRRATLS